MTLDWRHKPQIEQVERRRRPRLALDTLVIVTALVVGLLVVWLIGAR